MEISNMRLDFKFLSSVSMWNRRNKRKRCSRLSNVIYIPLSYFSLLFVSVIKLWSSWSIDFMNRYLHVLHSPVLMFLKVCHLFYRISFVGLLMSQGRKHASTDCHMVKDKVRHNDKDTWIRILFQFPSTKSCHKDLVDPRQ